MTDAKKRGGRRAGAGRRPRYGDPVTEEVYLRLSPEAASAIARWCRERGVPLAALIREAGLAAAGAPELGVGVRKLSGTVEREVRATGHASLTVKLTGRQARALRVYCARRRVQVTAFLREAALEHVGASGLGARGAIRDLKDLRDSVG